MSIVIDHVGIPAADPWASALFLGEILGAGSTTQEGPDGKMVNLSVGHGALTYFELPVRAPHHVAFLVTAPVFTGAIERLRQRHIPFGNDPESPSNGQTSDPLGGIGRIYFHDPNGHLFELFIPAES